MELESGTSAAGMMYDGMIKHYIVIKREDE